MSQRDERLNPSDFYPEQIVNFDEARAQKLEEKRKSTERLFFKNLISAYSVVDERALVPIEFLELSETHCTFQVPYDPSFPIASLGGPLPIRIYFSQSTYLELQTLVKSERQMIERGQRLIRFTCEIDRTSRSYETFIKFVHFLKSYSENLHKDLGDTTAFYL